MTNNNLSRRTILTTTATATTVGSGVMTGVGGAQNGSKTNETSEADDSDASATNSTADAESEDVVRVAHLAPDVGPIDIYEGSDRALSDIAFLDYSDYVSYAPERDYTLDVVSSDTEDPDGEGASSSLLTANIHLETGEYTLGLVGEQCATSDRPLDLVAYEDDHSDPGDDTARFRVIHASPDAPALDIQTPGGQSLIDGIEFGDAATAEVPADIESVVAFTSNGSSDRLGAVKFEPTGGSIYTAFAVGYLNPDDAPSSIPEPQPFALGFTEDPIPSND